MEREDSNMSFNGDLYPTAGADVVMTTKGDMVDYNTSRQRLAIGSTNQILQVKSALPSWETVDLADTVLTTAGDVLYENSTPALARLAAGTQYYNLQMGSALPAWSASSSSTMTAAQDILYSSSANTLARLAAGSDGDVLTTHSTGSAPTWETPAGGSSVLELLDTYQATGAEATTTLSWSSIDMKADYSAIYIVYQISSTASLEIQAQIDGITAGEYAGGSLRQSSTTLTGASWGWSDSIPTGTTNIWTTANDAGAGDMLIQFNVDNDRWYYNWRTTSPSVQEWGCGYCPPTGLDENITQVLFQTSTSTWKIGSTISVYGIKRT